MTKKRPNGPTWASERDRPWRERIAEVASGTVPLMRARFDRYGDLFFIDREGAGMFVTRHPDHIHEALVERGADWDKRSRDLEPFLGEGLLTSNGELWRRQRRLVQPAFSRPKLKIYSRVMTEYTQRMIAGWSAGEVRDIGKDMMELTLSVVVKTLFDRDDAKGAVDNVRVAMAGLQDTTGALDILPDWMPTPMHRRRKKAIKAIDDVVYPMIDAREGDPDAPDLLGQLKYAQDDQGGMSRKLLRDELVTLFLAGHETTAQALTWAFWLLSRAPSKDKLLSEELTRVLDGRVPSYEDIANLPFTEAVVKEALRMFPPIYILPRVANRDTTLAGYDVDEGAELVVWTYLCHRDERWFPQAEEFIPERWLVAEGEGVKHPHAYLPFGTGARQCIGSHFAMIEAVLLLAAIAQRFSMKRVDDRPVVLDPRVTLGSQKPIRLELNERA